MANEKQVERVFGTLCAYGLRMEERDLTARERKRQKDILRDILQDRTPDELCDAIRYGMSDVWPFMDGRVWDANDLRTNILKALGSAGKTRRKGQIPVNAQKVRMGG